MDFLTHLWIPILVAAAAVWIVSAIIWMALPHHKDDWSGLPDEDGMLRNFKGLPPGNYAFPHVTDRKQCKDPEFRKKWEQGPSGFLTIAPKLNMGKNMVLTLLVYLVVSTLIAYVAWTTLGHHEAPTHSQVLQVVATVGILSYSFAFIPNGIWFSTSRRALFMNFVDGIIYGLVTGAVFAWTWPSGT